MIQTSVKRLPIENGVSGWEAISTRPFPIRSLEGNVTADWLIVGAGFAGLSAARRLLQLRPDDKIVILDASEVGKGGSGRNSGFMIDVPHNLSSGEYSTGTTDDTRVEMAQNRTAIAFATQAAAEYGMSSETFDPSGKINAAATEHGLTLNRDFGRSLTKAGEKHRFLDAVQMRDITGTDFYLGGIYTPGAVLIQPADYIRNFAAGLCRQADIFERSPVKSLIRENGVWKASSPQGSVSAPKVILGVNGHINDFGHFNGRLMHFFGYASMTEPFQADDFGRRASGCDRWALLPADPMGATVRKITSNGQSRIALRTKWTYDTTLKLTDKRLRKMAREHRSSLDKRFPGLKDLPFEYCWAGRICLTRNHVPAFGEVEEGLYSACCENGLGTVKSTLAGMLTAELATGSTSSHLKEFMDHAKPSRLPPEPFTWLGANAVIRWQELRAGREG
ncbi:MULTISPECIES: FAD-binding oxidoreductase [Agrobacterium]|uniref:FAD-binding oxidoreductase n=1 Tax=Agrobacterium tumefaciens TaxID=358 RepID=A0AAE6BHI5_AGRTU|nr:MULTISPECIES: FAD-binding oxidoreductase [Agrobacterium]QCL77301.1 FAD-binding oxidoreductase [Agrobacterium tumefaciens]QCL82808.1 FAD-binding oxidoreductase [Agrobacterium tumefaciens]WCK05792.1 FAD-binding oxidoreductase [Agrobacterium tumefaciens]CUX71924.1 putative FAD dependent oxidoreductase [Agrobacterium sp. NCPPB 925]